MQKIQTFMFATMIATIVAGGIAANALADEFLANGNSITEEKKTDREEILLLTGGGVDVDCSFLLVDRVIGRRRTVQEILALNGMRPTLCEVLTGTCESAEVVGVHEPWEAEITLKGEAFDETFKGTGGEPGFELDCLVLGIVVKDTCTGKLTEELGNVTGGVEGLFVENDEVNPDLSCSLGGEGDVEGTGIEKLEPEGTLTVS